MSGTNRKALYRARKAAGLKIISVEVDEVNLECLLESYRASSLSDLVEKLIIEDHKRWDGLPASNTE